MSRISSQLVLTCSTSIAILFFAGQGIAQVIVDPSTTFEVTPGLIVNDQIYLQDGSLLRVDNNGTVTAVGHSVQEFSDGLQINVENAGTIFSGNGAGVFAPDSALSLINSGLIDGGEAGIGAENLSFLRNDSLGLIRGNSLYGVSVFDETNLVINLGEIIGQTEGFRGVGYVDTIINSGRVEGVNGVGFLAESDLGFMLNKGSIKGSVAGMKIDGSLAGVENSGIIQGLSDAIVVENAIFAVHNTGIISALSGNGVTSNSGPIVNLTNAGQISGTSDGVSANGGMSSFKNFGTIKGGQVGVFSNDAIAMFLNGGLISGNNDMGLSAGDINHFNNFGTISSTSATAVSTQSIVSFNNAGTIAGFSHGVDIVGTVHEFQNHGTIKGQNDHGVTISEKVHSFTNTGLIISETDIGIDLDDATTFTNSGTIIGKEIAIKIGDGEGTDVFLKQGSNIQGLIAIKGPSTLNTEFGMNLDLTFSEDLPSIIDTASAPFAVKGDKIVVVDPTGFFGTDLFANNLTRSAHDIVTSSVSRLPFSVQDEQTKQNTWISSFGGQSLVSDVGRLRDNYGGVIGGVDLTEVDTNLFGLFGGLAVGEMSADDANHSSVSKAVFAGGYFQKDFEPSFFHASLIGGYVSSNGDRHVQNNLAKGGFETANSNYAAYFVSPSVEFGARFEDVVANRPVAAKMRLSYLHLYEDGYSETEVESPITVENSQNGYFHTRAQITVPQPIFFRSGTKANLEISAGIDGQFGLGDVSKQGSVLETEISLVPSQDEQLIRGFLEGKFWSEIQDGKGAIAIGAAGFLGNNNSREFRGDLSFRYVF